MAESFLGIDMAKLKFDVALLQNSKYKTKTFKNCEMGFADLIDWLRIHAIHPIHACLESTGVYSEPLSKYLFSLDYKVSVLNPTKIKRFGQSELSRTKTDKTDAKLIARYCQVIRPHLWQPLPESNRLLHGWVKRLEGLQGMYQEEQNRLESCQEGVKSSITEVCTFLAKKIKEVNLEIKNHINQHQTLKKQKELLSSIPGVGDYTIARILSFDCTPGRFKTAKQLVAFVGLSPKQRESGSSVWGKSRISKTGDASLRKALYMPALTAKKYNPIIKIFYERLLGVGKPKMLIIGAIMRKLLHIIFGVLKTAKPF